MRAGSPWECDPLLCHRDPALQAALSGNSSRIGGPSSRCLGVARERGPAERALALAEQRADIGRDEAEEVERARVAREPSLGSDGVAVVEDLGALVHEADHGLDVRGHRLARAAGELLGVLGGVGRDVLEVDAEGRYDSGSCAEVWSVTMSIGASSASSCGTRTAALPRRPIDRPRRASRASTAGSSACSTLSACTSR